MSWLGRLGAALLEALLGDLIVWARKKYADWQAQKKLDSDLQKAGEHAKETKDTSQAEDILRGNTPKP